MTDRSLRLAAAIVALAGVVVAGYLTWAHYADSAVTCLAGRGCETVQESEYAVIAPYLLTQYESDRGRSVGRMRELLAARFERIGEVGGAPWPVYEVYRRLATVRPASRAGDGRMTN